MVHNRDVFVALDVAKMKNAVAIADGGRRGDVRCLGDITHHLRTHGSRLRSRMTRLAYLSPDVLDRLLVWRERPAVSLKTLIAISYPPWAEQMGRVFEERSITATAEPGPARGM